MGQLMRWAYHHWLPVLLLLFGITALALTQVGKVKIDASADSLMIHGTEQQRIYRQTLEKFGSDNIVVVFVEDAALFSPGKLEALEQLEKELTLLPQVSQHESLFTVSRLDGSQGFLNSGPLVEWLPDSQDDADAIAALALRNPILRGNLISDDRQATAINLYLNLAADQANADLLVAEQIDLILARYRPQFDQVFQLGMPNVWQTITASLNRDMCTLIPLAAAVLLVMLMLATRSLSGALLPMCTAGISIVWTFAFMGIAGIPVNILTMIVPPLIIVLGSTEDIHLLTEYQAELKATGNREQAILALTFTIGTAVMLTSLTTVLGFLSITTNRIAMLRHFGLAAGFGMFVNPLVTVLFTPVYLRFFGARQPRVPRRLSVDRGLDSAADALLRQLRKYPLPIFGGLWIGAAVIGVFALRVQVDNNLLGYFRADTPIIANAQHVHARLAGGQLFYVRISSGFADAFSSAANLQPIVELQQQIGAIAGVDKVTGLADYITLINREINGGDPQYAQLPEEAGAISQYLLLLRPGETQRYISADAAEVNLVVRHNIHSSYELKQVVSKIEQAAAAILNPHFKCMVTGEGVLLNEAADSIAGGQAWSIVLLLAIIFVIMAVMFVNVKASILSLLPNIFPVVVLFGMMGILGVSLNPGTCMVAVIVIGLALDDTIHLMTRYNREMRRFADEAVALEHCLRDEFKPVICTSLGLTLGFAVLGLSSFKPILHFGLLSAMIMVVALAGDLMITPILLARTKLLTLWDVLGLKLRDEVVRQSELFAGLRPWQIKRVILLGRIIEVAEGANLYCEGEDGDSMFFILDGRVRTWGHDSSGSEVNHAALLPSDVVGEVNLVVAGQRSEMATAITAVTCVQFQQKDFERLRQLLPRTGGQVLCNLTQILGNRLTLAQWLARETMTL